MTARSELAAVVFALTALAASPPAIAGSSNTLYLSQDGVSNRIQIDQSGASNSTVGGVTLPDALTADELTPSNLAGTGSPAQQSGFSNSADITITGSGEAGLLQNNLGAQTYKGNSATMAISAGALGLIGQRGDNNTADLTVSGADAFGGIVQNGDNNKGTLNVNGTNVSGTMVQNGSGNDTGLDVTGTSGSNVSYTLNANGVTTTSTIPQVTTIGGVTVNITQTMP